VRVSAAASALVGGGRSSAPTVPSPSGGIPPIVSQPTTPIDSPGVNRRQTPRERRDNPRRVADRSVAMRRAGSSGLGWLWLVLAIAGGVGGAAYYYSKRGFAPFAEAAAADSLAADSVAAADSVRAAAAPPADSPAPTSPAPASASTGSPPPPSAAPVSPRATARRPAPPPAGELPITPVSNDTGSVRLVGLPRGSTVLIDERPVTEPTTRLSAGPHVLAVSAPRFNFFTDTIVVRAGETIELTPQLQPIGAPAPPAQDASPPAAPRAARASGPCAPGAGYNADGSCFDERPKPVNPPFVPLPEGVTGTPRPSLLWVKVSAEGRTLDLRQLRPSDDSTFERAARDFVWTVAWHPALKDGAAVEAWTQMLFPPQPE
jgi:hypothetical protein